MTLNGVKFVEIEYTHQYLIPMFSFERQSEVSSIKTSLLSKCLEYNNSINAKKYTKTDLNSLINHRLEAMDQQFPNLISPATIGINYFRLKKYIIIQN